MTLIQAPPGFPPKSEDEPLVLRLCTERQRSSAENSPWWAQSWPPCGLCALSYSLVLDGPKFSPQWIPPRVTTIPSLLDDSDDGM